MLKNTDIAVAFGSDAGVRLMRIDSELILGALRAANDDGFGALPVHDSLIVPVDGRMLSASAILGGRPYFAILYLPPY